MNKFTERLSHVTSHSQVFGTYNTSRYSSTRILLIVLLIVLQYPDTTVVRPYVYLEYRATYPTHITTCVMMMLVHVAIVDGGSRGPRHSKGLPAPTERQHEQEPSPQLGLQVYGDAARLHNIPQRRSPEFPLCAEEAEAPAETSRRAHE